MEVKSAKWFEVTYKFAMITEDGSQKIVKATEVYDALSFTEAETKCTESNSLLEEFEITDIKIARYNEFVYEDDSLIYYKICVKMITLDEKTGKEKKTPVCYLISAKDSDDASRIIKEHLRTTMTDYEIYSISETKIIGHG